ncbi:GntR family transcriptional regulator, transcriptional repressor for pyruvate dehydrogenase complex [Desulfitobacterium chlororespirans DSM 11544]|uniref:GntR family transcriptional regulator, transcriptional repressor for pyruvate dehydrogenase complex n=1 Tax=Desulfitobacterium chlororespirans DSM 11544 TaxID=1121395 RepID=A0A1M7S190_9FIRM|nr:GntR family transcriptional regulator, transcriptional repressor for pyruvate dehydrogenase complex [Desulfitobacterium chlororespirans DSM 11544]
MEKGFNTKRKLKRLPLTEQVYNALKEGIISGKWQIGDKLPSENELAEYFGVNRLTVRGALQKLNILGIVETRVGEGTFVLSFDFRKYISEVTEFTLQPEDENDIREFRRLFEIEAVRLAIEKGTEKELAVLKKLAEECDELCKRLTESYTDQSFDKEYFMDSVNADLDFHYQIFKMSHNTLYINCFNLARESIHRYILARFERAYNHFAYNYFEKGGTVLEYKRFEHMLIYNYIKEKDFEGCKKIYIKHDSSWFA